MKWLIMIPLALAALSGAAYADKIVQNTQAPTAGCRTFDCMHKTQPTASKPDGIVRPKRPAPPYNGFRGANGGQRGVTGRGSK